MKGSKDPRPANHPTTKPRRIGILLLNLGTPDATDYWSMRRYLNEFLSDQRVIDYSRLFWQPLLQLVILSKRPFTSGAAYRSIWNNTLNESPLRTITRNQSEALAARLQDRHPEILVDWAMRYGNPSTESVLERMVESGCDRIALMALYPQYAAATTATAYDKAFDALKKMRWQPAIRTMPPYHDHPTYIRLIAASIERHLAQLDWQPERLLISYHGLPKRYLLSGDPYYCMCQKSSRLIREQLGWTEQQITTVFQSRFGSEEWLQPYLDETLEALPASGIKRIAVISPAFAADCLETLEEINEEGQKQFLDAGGERFTYIPCLNDSAPHIDLLTELAQRETAGWISLNHDPR